MPRLLLVDDNPSIHRIAESLLAPTDVELVCVDSAAEALDRLGRGERFDVALVDTAMPGMDGWTLLTRLRAMEETARMPIALMAGVLDPVDPAKLAKAPIQGFLKKPIELRELGDRVKALLVTPVVLTPSPFSTVPATPARDLVKRAEEALPEFRPEPAVEPVEELTEAPESILSVDLDLAQPDEDLLVLTAEDLWPEEPAPALPGVEEAPVLPDVQLELEELDLDSLQDLTIEPPTPSDSMTQPEPAFSFEADPISMDDDDQLVTLSGLEDLETFSSALAAESAPVEFEAAPVAEPATDPVEALVAEPLTSPAEEVFPDLAVAAALIGGAGVAGVAMHEAQAHVHVPPPPEPEHAYEISLPAAAGQVPAVPSQAVVAPVLAAPTPVPSEQAQALLQALLADPVMVDALVKAVVARMGDQVLREIAWEVMPDLAGRLQR